MDINEWLLKCYMLSCFSVNFICCAVTVMYIMLDKHAHGDSEMSSSPHILTLRGLSQRCIYSRYQILNFFLNPLHLYRSVYMFMLSVIVPQF